jgi:hypothetical protein
VYVSASSKECDRAVKVANRIKKLGGTPMYSWVESVRQFGGNSKKATEESRIQWAQECQEELFASDVLLCLVPLSGVSCGQLCELGLFYGFRGIIVSDPGDNRHKSIFYALADKTTATDESAIVALGKPLSHQVSW